MSTLTHSLLIRADTTLISGTLNDLTTDLIMEHNNNMQFTMYVPLLLLHTASGSRGAWAVLVLHESLGYVEIACVLSVSKSPLSFVEYYKFGVEDRKQVRDSRKFVACR